MDDWMARPERTRPLQKNGSNFRVVTRLFQPCILLNDPEMPRVSHSLP